MIMDNIKLRDSFKKSRIKLKKKKPDLTLLNELQLDFYFEREAIMYIAAIEEFGECNELELSWKVFEYAKKLF